MVRSVLSVGAISLAVCRRHSRSVLIVVIPNTRFGADKQIPLMAVLLMKFITRIIRHAIRISGERLSAERAGSQCWWYLSSGHESKAAKKAVHARWGVPG